MGEERNPYVGPRTFEREESHLFFGRDEEAKKLLSLILSERLVLFYAQSGAGKSSLINTRLIPDLEAKNFEVLPVGRVSGESHHDAAESNIFIFNLLLSLDRSSQTPDRFAQMSLVKFLDKFAAPNGAGYRYDDRYTPAEILPRVLIIDQFEELLAVHPEAWEKRADFFDQLRQALEADPYLWVVLVMREDYVAALDAYVHLLPGRLQARFYMQRMRQPAALQAIKNPVRDLRPFDPDSAKKLVDNLRQIRIQSSDGTQTFAMGQFVEPVQLQVVCYQLWENLRNKPKPRITDEDLRSLAGGDDLARFVNNALAQFYEQAIAAVLQDPTLTLSELELREWFSEQLITGAETRGLVYHGREETGGLPNEAIHQLEKQFLIRAVSRAGGTWYELVHDRFVDPILQANHAWQERRLRQNPLIKAAQAWVDSGKREDKLYRGEQLREALAAVDQAALDPVVAEFLEASKTTRKTRRRRRLFIGLIIISIVMLAAAIFAFSQQQEAERLRNLAEARAAAEREAKETAQAAKVEAERSRQEAVSQASEARIAQQTAVALQQQTYLDNSRLRSQDLTGQSRQALPHDPNLALVLALEAHKVLASWDEPPSPEAQYALVTAAYASAARRSFDHGSPVYAAAVSPDDRYFLSGGADGALILWDYNTGAEVRRLTGHTGAVWSVAISPDGQTALSGSADNSLILWDLQTGAEIRRFAGHTDTVWSVAISPDGQTALSGSADNSLILWDLQTGDLIRRLEGHDDWVYSVAFSPDGQTAISGANDTRLILWNLETGEEIRRFEGHDDWVRSVAFSPDGRQILSGSTGVMILWDAAGGEAVRRFENNGDSIYSLAFSPDRQRILSGSTEMVLWDSESGQAIRRFRGHAGRVRVVAFSREDRRTALSGSMDGTLQLWDLENGAEIGRLAKQSETEVWSAAVSPDGQTALTGLQNGDLILWDLKSKEEVRRFGGHTAGVGGVAFSPDGQTALSGSEDDTLIWWDVETGEVLKRFKEHTDNVYSVAFSPDGGAALSGSEDGSVIYLNLETGRPIYRLTEHTEAVHRVAFSPDGRTALSGSSAGRLILWDLDRGREIRRFEGHADTVWRVAFSPDGRTALSGSLDGTMILWDIETGQAIHQFRGHTDAVYALAFVPDGRTVLSGSGDGGLRLWRLLPPTSKLVDWVAGNRYIRALTCLEKQQYNLGVCATPPPPTTTPTPITTTTPLTATLGDNRGFAPVGQRDLWLYEGEAGEALTVRVNADRPANAIPKEERLERGVFDPYLAVWGPDGQPLDKNDDIENVRNTDALLEKLVLPVAGSYQIEVRSWDNATGGGYTLKLEKPPTITLDRRVAGTIEAGENTLLAFEGQAGQIVMVALQAAESSDLDPHLTLLGPDGAALTGDGKSGGGVNALISGFTLPEDGRYTLALAGEDNTAGDYTLTLTDLDKQPLALGQTVSGRIEDSLIWTFEAGGGQVVNLSLRPVEPDQEARLTLLKTDGTPLATGEAGGESRNLRLNNFILPADDAYTILPNSVSGTGGYTLTLTPALTQPIAFNRPATGFNDAGSVWIFEGRAGRIINIALDAVKSGLDPALSLQGPDRTTLATDDNSGVGANARINNFVLPKDGLYTIIPTGGDGAYTLSLTPAPTRTIAFNRPATGALETETVWIFEGSAGQIVRLEMTAAGELDPRLILLAPDGAILRTDDDSGDDNDALMHGVALPESGAYTVIPGGDGDSGTYTLTLTPLTLHPLEFDAPATGTLARAVAWTFSGEAEQRIEITLDAAGDDVDPRLTLLSPDGSILSADDDGGEGRNALMTVILPEEGRYTIIPGGYSRSGAYRLSLIDKD